MIIPGLAATYLALRWSVERAFLDVWLPVLLLLPEYYRLVLPGLPDLTFGMATILPIGVIFVMRGWRSWRYGLTDLLTGLYAGWIVWSEWLNAGFGAAQNLSVEVVGWVLLPYVLGKGVIEPGGVRVAAARRMVWLLVAVSVLSIWEMRMGSNPWRLMLDWWFPGQAMEWVTTFRWGLARIAGPYGHAILAGVLLVSGYRIQRWLEWNGGWEPVFAGMEWLPWRKARWLTVILLAGVLMSLVRGPWIGGLVAAVVAKVGRSRDKEAAIWATMALLLALVVPAVTVGWSYAAVGRVNALTVAQESAAYRKELVDKYIDIAIEHSLIGWGRNTWPRVGGLGSIDNHFLLLTLMHGVTALLLLVAILVRMIFRLFRQGMREPPQSGFSFTLLGIFWAIVVSLLTVYMGNQLVPFFFLMVGWAEGYLLTVRLGRVRTGGLRFREVLA